MYRFILWVLILLLPAVGSAATERASNNNDNTHEYHLKNGLQLIVREDHRAPVVFSSVWYKVGGSYEPNGITGISHALEHMMFRGTPTYGPGKLAKMVNAAGGSQNAMTAGDFTVYFQALPADQLSLSFKLEADRMQHLLLRKEDFKKELQVVMEERRMRYDDDPQSMTMMMLNATAHTNNPDHHPVIGWMNDLKQMQISDLRQWYHSWYGPNNAVVIVVGDVKAPEVLALAKRYFGKLKPVKLPEQKQHLNEPQIASRHINVHLPAKTPWLMMAYNTPSIATAHPQSQAFALALLADILGGSDSSRLSKDLVRQQQVAVGASSRYDWLRLYDTLLTIYAVPAPGKSDQAVMAAIQAEIKRLQQQPVTEAELKRVKAQFIAQYIYDKDSLMSQAMQIGQTEMIGLSWKEVDHIIQQIQAVTPQQIQSVAKAYLTPNRLTTATLIPEPLGNDKSVHTKGVLDEQPSAIH